MNAETLLAALDETGIEPINNQDLSDAVSRGYQGTALMGEQQTSVVETQMRDALPEPNAPENAPDDFTALGLDIRATLDM